MNLPEHDKLQNIQEQSNFVGEFIEWLKTTNRTIATQTFTSYGEPTLKEDRTTINALLAEMFEINLVKLETEKQLMLDSIRQLTKLPESDKT
jgi:hypothetical protein